MMLPREGLEGQHYSQTPVAPLVSHYVEPGGMEFVHFDRSVGMVEQQWIAHHLLSPNVQLTVEPLHEPTLERSLP